MAQAKSLTQEDVDAVLRYISTRRHATRNRLMFLFTVLAGLRVSEVAQLTIGDVRNIDGTIKSQIFLSAQRVKHGHARTVFLSAQLQHELSVYLTARMYAQGVIADHMPLFHTLRGIHKAFTASTLTQHFHYLYRRARVFGASSHSGRRTFITNLSNSGISVFVLASLAGHKNIATTNRYVTVNDEQKRRAVNCLNLQIA
jgi:integrase/recombinase XerD